MCLYMYVCLFVCDMWRVFWVVRVYICKHVCVWVLGSPGAHKAKERATPI